MVKKRKPEPIDPFTQVSIDLPDLTLETSLPPSGPAGTLFHDSLSPIDGFDFDRCPICLSTDDLTAEHVPPEQAGGGVATKTCGTCNSRFGFLVDVDLIEFLSSSTKSRWRNEDSVQGFRSGGRTLLRRTPDGRFAILMSGDERLRGELRQMLEAGPTTGEFQLSDMRRVRVSALKNAYLAACVQLREIPRTASADRIRSELLAVRECRRRREALPPTPIANEIMTARVEPDFPTPGLYVCRFDGPYGERTGVLLGGHLLVEWPFSDLQPGAADHG
jgi:hypothetical protein